MDTSHFMGMNNFVWWMGIVENRIDPLKTGRCQIRKFAWDSANKAMVPTEALLWAHPILPLNNADVVAPKEGVMVMGFFMDGEGAQHPIMMGQIPGIPDTKPNISEGFSDPRTDTELAAAPRPPQDVKYNQDGSGAAITEGPAAQRFPQVLNEPTTSRIARNENIEDTIIAQKNNNLVSSVPVSTGGLAIDNGIDIAAAFSIQPTISIAPFSISVDIPKGFEICGLGIGIGQPLGLAFGGLN